MLIGVIVWELNKTGLLALEKLLFDPRSILWLNENLKGKDLNETILNVNTTVSKEK